MTDSTLKRNHYPSGHIIPLPQWAHTCLMSSLDITARHSLWIFSFKAEGYTENMLIHIRYPAVIPKLKRQQNNNRASSFERCSNVCFF